MGNSFFVWVMAFLLLKPLLDVLANQEVVNCQANPAGTQYQYCYDKFPGQVDVFLEYVEHAPNGAYKTNDVKNKSHNCLCFLVKFDVIVV